METKALALMVLLCLTPPLLAQGSSPVADFECQPANTLLPWAPATDCEGWTSLSGAQAVVGWTVQTPAGDVLPTSGSRYLEVSSLGTGPASPVVPPSTPGLYPFAPGSVSEAQLPVFIPSFPSGTVEMEFDWYWATDETPGQGFDDFAQIALIDSSQQVAQVLLYVDTYSPNVINGGNTVPSWLSLLTPFNYQAGDLHSTRVRIDPGLVGQSLTLSIVCANQGDWTYPSILCVDNIRFVDPGGGFSFTLSSSGGGSGDLSFGVQGIPAGVSDVQILLSQTPGPGGLGTGPVFGLVPDALFFSTYLQPSVPGSLFHFPVSANPYAAGLLTFPPGALTALAGQTWQGVAFAYTPAGFYTLSNHQGTTF